jgi:hypothetical protein
MWYLPRRRFRKEAPKGLTNFGLDPSKELAAAMKSRTDNRDAFSEAVFEG